MNRILYSCDIGITAKIPATTIFHHCALGCTLGNDVVLGDNCQLFTNITIGNKSVNGENTGNPIIGNNVIIGAGAIILGQIKIGDNTTIAAGAVVLNDIPSDALVAGNPGKVIKIYGEWIAKWHNRPIKANISGSDLVPIILCGKAAEKGYSIFIIGGKEGIAEKAKQNLERDLPGIKIVGTYAPPFGFEKAERELKKSMK